MTRELLTGCEHNETDPHPVYDSGGQLDGCLGGVYPAILSEVMAWLEARYEVDISDLMDFGNAGRWCQMSVLVPAEEVHDEAIEEA